jgi:hypothetical protein
MVLRDRYRKLYRKLILKSTTEVTLGREKRRKKMGKKKKNGKKGKKWEKEKNGEKEKRGKNKKKIKKYTNSNFGFHIGYSVCQPKRTSGAHWPISR